MGSLYSKINTQDYDLRIVDVYKTQSPISYFQVKEEAFPLLREFRDKEMATSDIFTFVWKKNLISVLGSHSVTGLDEPNYLFEENFFQSCFAELLGGFGDDISLPNLPMNLNGVIMYILLPSLSHTQQIMQQLISGDIKVPDALSFVGSCNLEKDLHKLISFFEFNVYPEDIKMCLQRLNCAKVMKSCMEQSKDILNTAEVLELKGDFKSVKIIGQKVKFI